MTSTHGVLTVPRAAGALTVTGLAALAARYARATAGADRAWATQVERRLTDLGEVDELTILPLVERLVAGDGAPSQGEPGLSYLVRAGGGTLVFDTGLNLRGADRPALVANADRLGVDLATVDGIVISHQHADHIGGPGMVRRRTFGFSPEPLEPRGVPAFVPSQELTHDRADVVATTGPRVVAPGIAVLPRSRRRSSCWARCSSRRWWSTSAASGWSSSPAAGTRRSSASSA